MSFTRYESYKDSGVQWLEEVPSHWQVAQFRRCLSTSLANGLFKKKEAFGQGTLLVNVFDIYRDDFRLSYATLDRVDATSEEINTYTVENGDLFFVRSSLKREGIAAVAIAGEAEEPVVFECHLIRARTNPSFMLPEFCIYLFNSHYHRAWLMMKAKVTTMTTIDQEAILSVPIVQFPVQEQLSIAKFLDRETAKIDALVDEQKRLIELLREKRQAVIFHAVTKGLDANVPMKDSGVAWIGCVPEHWQIVPTGYRYQVQLGRMLNEERSSGDHSRPYLRVFDVQWRFINTADLPEMDFPPEAQARYRLFPGDLLVNEGGSYVGRSAIWRGELDECYYQKALHRLRPKDAKRDTTEFFLFVMEAATRSGVFVAGGNQTTIDHLTAEQLRRYRFAFPPIAEQWEIADHLARKTREIDELVLACEDAVELLDQRRNALISAAVTGKIDVRNAASIEAKAA